MSTNGKPSVGVIYDNTVRGDTTGNYFYWGFQRLGHKVEHVHPDYALTQGAPKCDIYLKVDDGLKGHDKWNEDLRPCAYYAIDTHYWDASEWRPGIAKQFDITYTAQKDGVDFMRRYGVKGDVRWLPLAADENLHTPDEGVVGEKRYDWAFVGNVGHAQPDSPNKRMDYLDKLLKKFPNAIISDYSYFKEMANIYSLSKVVFNTCINNDINMRFWEGLCSGSYILTEEVVDNGEKELCMWKDAPLYGSFSTYRDFDELVDTMGGLLSPSANFRLTHEVGGDLVLAGHTYQHRCKQILEDLEEIS